MYKVNDIVVYHRDVCKVIGRHKSDYSGEEVYILVPYAKQDGSVRMQVPVANRGGHLRDLITKDGINDLIASAPKVKILENKPANMKSQYAALMKSESLEDLICIIKTSYRRNQERLMNNKKVASVDTEYLQKAEKYLFEELSVVLGMSADETKQYFSDAIRASEPQS